MSFWKTFLSKHHDYIVDQWQRRLLTEVSERYAKREPSELKHTTGKACEAFTMLLTQNDYGPINDFICEITKIRLEAGFPLADVQKAFELFREIVIPMLIRECPIQQLQTHIESLNRGLAYTIHRFSNHFQQMHENYLKSYAERLERDVSRRTVELRESEQKYRGLVEEISDGYLVLNNEKIVFINSAFCQIHGMSRQEILSKSFLDFVAPQHRNKVKKMITQTAGSNTKPEAFEYLRLKKDGTLLPSEINFKPSWFKGKKYHLCIVRDITKRVEMERKSRDLERMAYIGKLTASLSHEMRNPLSSVKMNLQILGQNHNFRGNDKKRLEIAEREIHRVEKILQELLDFAKPVTLKPVKTNINRIISSCVELLSEKIVKQRIDCIMQLDENLPPIMVDEGKMEQVVINLLLNALESLDGAENGSGRIHLVSAKRETPQGQFAVIHIRDNGKGIANEISSRIFEPFYTTKRTGTGLGLANVKRIMEAHGGRVNIIHPDTAGIAFEAILPIGEENGKTFDN